MSILEVNVNTTGLIGNQINPRRVTMITTDSLSTITTSGYLNKLTQQGYNFFPSDIFDIWYSWNELTKTGIFNRFYPTFSRGIATLNINLITYLSSPFYVNGVAVTTTGTQLNYLNQLTSVPIDKVNSLLFTSNGTYTPTAGMVYCIIECIGGGGAGGAVTSSTTRADTAGGGGGGGYARSTFTKVQIGTSQVVTIGQGGAPSGNPGTNTSVGSLVVGDGGGAGGGGAGGISGIGGGAFAVGQFVSFGVNGGAGVSSNTTNVAIPPGYGGGSGFGGQGGTANCNIAQNGVAGQGYGAGGSGACGFASNSAFSGGAGSAGAVIITEYLSI